MVWWLIIVVANVGGIAALLRARRKGAPRSVFRRFAFVGAALVAGCGGLSVVSLIRVLNVVQPVGVGPSQKARILAEGISECLNCLATGVMAFAVPTLLALVLLFRTPKKID